jgi:hypothetical protein
MRWRNIAFMTVVLVFILSSPAASQQWVDIKNPKELRALHSNKTFKMTFMGVSVVEHYRADRKGMLISAELRMPCTWEVKGNDQVCVSDERGTNCWQFQRSKKNPHEYVKRNVKASLISSSPKVSSGAGDIDAYMVVFKVEDGIPQF